MHEDLGTLCRACGLCCDGSLFGRVALDADEAPTARAIHLRVLPSGRAFEQPCTALAVVDAGRICTRYAERPRRCASFECRLRARHAREGGPLEPRLAAVRRVRDLLARVEAGRDASDPALREELTARIEADFARA